MNFHLQCWGDHTDISQAVAMYIMAVGSLCLYCGLANELSQEVRKMMLLIRTEFTFLCISIKANILSVM